MKPAPLRALLWKDFRRTRTMLILATFLLILPYLAFLEYGLINQAHIQAQLPEWVFKGGSVLSFYISFLLIAIFVATVTTGEYSDRSANFLAYLPASNASILVSKIICLIAPSVLWLTSCALMLYSLSSQARFQDGATKVSIATFISIYGVAWLVGLTTRKGLWSMFFAIIAPIVILWIRSYGHVLDTKETVNWYSIVALSVGLISFALGWVYGLRWGRTST